MNQTFTNMLDKEGKKIHRYDIVEPDSYGGEIFVVDFFQEGNRMLWTLDPLHNLWSGDEVTILGNIFEDLDLVEEVLKQRKQSRMDYNPKWLSLITLERENKTPILIDKAKEIIDDFLKSVARAYSVPVSYIAPGNEREVLEEWAMNTLKEEDIKDEI